MKTFLTKTTIALLIAGACYLAAGFMADGTTDEYYLRFTTSRQKSMVLGGSRSAQGLHPAVFNSAPYPMHFEGPLYNYSFTIAHSPYGPSYLRAIVAKLDTRARNGIFIVQVDPWLLSASKHDPNDILRMTERQRALGKMLTFNWHPNYEYILRYYDRGLGALGHWPQGDPDTNAVLQNDGNLQLHITMDTATVAERTRRKAALYERKMFRNRMPSPKRLEYLGKIVDLLKPHGSVMIVRFPVGEGIMDLERRMDPQFDMRMQQFAQQRGVRYVNGSINSAAYRFTDGNHLDEPSGLRFSRQLADELLRARGEPQP